MKISVLASGSKGNSIYVEGTSDALLIDAGLSARELLRRLEDAGGNRDLIGAILVTHEHGDHIRGVDVLARRLDIPVIATKGTLEEFLAYRRTSNKTIQLQPCMYGHHHAIGGFTVEPFATMHDAREPCGFLVREGDCVVGCCTDTGVITGAMQAAFTRCDALVLESNHCPDMLQSGPYPAFLKRRIRSKTGHLSNTDAAGCLSRLAGDLHAVILAHLSEVNNTREKARTCAGDGLGLYRDAIELVVGRQDEATRMLSL
jgi:phosphoribosyl 1,2-cyclic phosphodiesterase